MGGREGEGRVGPASISEEVLGVSPPTHTHTPLRKDWRNHALQSQQARAGHPLEGEWLLSPLQVPLTRVTNPQHSHTQNSAIRSLGLGPLAEKQTKVASISTSRKKKRAIPRAGASDLLMPGHKLHPNWHLLRRLPCHKTGSKQQLWESRGVHKGRCSSARCSASSK